MCVLKHVVIVIILEIIRIFWYYQPMHTLKLWLLHRRMSHPNLITAGWANYWRPGAGKFWLVRPKEAERMWIPSDKPIITGYTVNIYCGKGCYMPHTAFNYWKKSWLIPILDDRLLLVAPRLNYLVTPIFLTGCKVCMFFGSVHTDQLPMLYKNNFVVHKVNLKSTLLLKSIVIYN